MLPDRRIHVLVSFPSNPPPPTHTHTHTHTRSHRALVLSKVISSLFPTLLSAKTVIFVRINLSGLRSYALHFAQLTEKNKDRILDFQFYDETSLVMLVEVEDAEMKEEEDGSELSRQKPN